MRRYYTVLGMFLAGLLAALVMGCAALTYLNERAITLEDIISMSKAKVSVDVIKTQIDVTHTKFVLTSDEIIRLKNEGVDDKVIEYMLETDYTQDNYWWEYGYAPYYYGYNYYNRYYYPYSNYYNYYGLPYQYSPFWGGYRRLYWNPYGTYRAPGLVGRFYYNYPLAPFFGEDLYSLDRRHQRRDLEQRDWNRLQRRGRDEDKKPSEEPER